MSNPAEESSHSAIPAFIGKLWHMVSDKASDDLISWGKDGTTFIIKDHNKFSSEMLPMYYKHSNLASFIRQLNMYNFHKVVLVDSSSLKNQKELEFSHPNFVKGKPSLLNHIQRKINSKEHHGEAKCDPVVFNSLLKEVQQLRSVQEHFSNKLTAMKKENAALWREHSILRQRHAKQEKIVNKVIHFLISMVQQSTINVTRRKLPLMIKDRPVFKPAQRRKYVRVVNHKTHPVICEVDPQDILNDINGEIVGEVVPEDLLLSCDSDDEEQILEESGNVDETIKSKTKPPLIQLKTATPNMNTTQGQKKQKRKAPIKIIKTGKKRKYDETQLSSEDLVPEVEEHATLSPASSFAESIPSPGYILINNEDGTSQIVKAGEVETTHNTSNGNKLYNQEIPVQQNISQIPVIEIAGNQFSTDPLQLQQSDIGQNYEGTNYILVTSPTPIVTSPAQSVPSPKTITNVEAGTSKAYAPLADITSSSEHLLQLAKPADINEKSFSTKEDAESHLDKVQSDLDVLKDLLKGEGISLDANMVLELFNDHPLDLNMGPAGQGANSQMQLDLSTSGQELMSYSPSLLDLENDLAADPDDMTYPGDNLGPDYELNTPQKTHLSRRNGNAAKEQSYSKL